MHAHVCVCMHVCEHAKILLKPGEGDLGGRWDGLGG